MSSLEASRSRAYNARIMKSLKLVLLTVVSLCAIDGMRGQEQRTAASLSGVEHLTVSLPPEGRFVAGKPVGKHWVNMLSSLDEWNADPRYWTLKDGILHGDYDGGKLHNYSYTKKNYGDFELNVIIRMTGREPNSGVCIHIHPTDADNVPGYQVDMGEGYWGSLWDERRTGMVQQLPLDVAYKLVHEGDWNHYYIIAKGNHIQAWLNGVKTIDIVHDSGFADGNIGFQLCHGNKHTTIDVKALYIRKL
jgi:hypothetical protein